MARRKKAFNATDMKMYRHFAIATVGITLAMAVFADGDNREAMMDNAAKAAETVQEAELTGIKMQEPKRSEHASYHSDPGSGTSYSGGTGSRSGLRTGGSPAWVAKLKKLGMTLEQFQALSKSEQEALLKILNASSGPVNEEQAIRNLSVGSLERSGGGEAADM